MAVPKQHRSKSRQGQRRANIFLKEPKSISCPKCGQPSRAHTVCKNCGFYRGRQVIDVLAKYSGKEKKQKEKELKNEGAPANETPHEQAKA